MGRFTLIELLTVMAIVAVLTTIGLPQFYEMQLKAKESEAYLVLDGVGAAQKAYHSTFDDWHYVWPSVPGGVASKQAEPWPATSDFDTIGFSPDGDVYGEYAILFQGQIQTCIGSGPISCLAPYGACGIAGFDLDSDGTHNCWQADWSDSVSVLEAQPYKITPQNVY